MGGLRSSGRERPVIGSGERPPGEGVEHRRLPVLRGFVSRDFLRYLGPGFIVTVGFIDPGNWATNVAGGSQFGYTLLWVITLGTLMLILYQSMSARLGIVTGHSLAYNIRGRFSRPWRVLFGVSIVLACIATDVAELLGGALGFQILFGIPLLLGGVITVVLQILLVLTGRYRHIERVVIAFIGIIALCYVIELALVNPDWGAAAYHAFVPSLNTASMLVAIGMLGAVVMPHNVYLHSNVVLEREQPHDEEGRRRLIRYEFGDTSLAMGLGWMINSAMVIVAAAVFYRHGVVIDTLTQASATLEPLAGSLARLLFGIGLLFAGLGSSFTSAMAEVNVLTAYLGRPEDPRTMFYRVGLFVLAIPALAIIALGGNPLNVLIYSQVALTVQLPLTIFPLLILVFSKKVMGAFYSRGAERILAVVATIVLSVLNILFLYTLAGGSL